MRPSLALVTVLAALAAAATAAARTDGPTVSVAPYSIPTQVFPKLISAYQATPSGQGVNFTTSFAASEVPSKAVAAGLPADLLNFSLSTDLDRLVSPRP